MLLCVFLEGDSQTRFAVALWVPDCTPFVSAFPCFCFTDWQLFESALWNSGRLNGDYLLLRLEMEWEIRQSPPPFQ